MITLHHLRIGRSVFCAWQLEELGIDYAIEIYVRDERGRAPAELRQIHPLGKSPVIEDDGLVIAESGAITAHLLANYDADGHFGPDANPAMAGDARAHAARFTQWLHYPEGSAFLPLLMTLLLSREAAPKPPVFAAFAGGEVPLHLNYIADALGTHDFIMGANLSAPDFGLGFIVSMANNLGLLDEYPTLQAYVERIMTRPAFAKAFEKTGG